MHNNFYEYTHISSYLPVIACGQAFNFYSIPIMATATTAYVKRMMILCGILLSFPGLFAGTSNLDGNWEGKLMISPEMGLRLGVNITDCEGEAAVTMDSPDQGAYGIPMQVDFICSDSLIVAVPRLMLKYEARLKADSITGVFTQGPLSFPLILKRKTATWVRPQTPRPPFPYITEDVIIQSCLDNANLYGTLSMPDKTLSKTPAVLLISGSGTQNRDEELFGHRPFAVISDNLARHGIASLRYDDRGFDESTGLTPNLTTYENAMDALGGINFLRQKGFSKIGIIGHSEGGQIADMIAKDGSLVDFIVELGGPAVPGDSILIYQNEFLLRDGGMPNAYISMYLEAMRGMFRSQKDIDPEPFDEHKYAIFSPENLANPVLAPLARNLRENFSSLTPWLRYFINYDPAADLKGISIPVLMLYGEKDTQVAPALNVPALEKINPNIRIKVYPDLNHLMQHSTTGKITEYAEIEETISPEVLEDIRLFIRSLE